MNLRLLLLLMAFASFVGVECARSNQYDQHEKNGGIDWETARTPATSEFWCGEHCADESRCEDYYTCLCSEAFSGNSMKAVIDASNDLAKKFMEANPEIRGSCASYVIDSRIVHHSTFPNQHFVCAVFKLAHKNL